MRGLFPGLCGLLLWATPLSARPPAVTDPEFAAWFHAQLQPGTDISCCDVADGHILSGAEWREGAAGPAVLVDGEWHDVPPQAVILRDTNPTGGAVVWYSPGVEVIYCFVRPPET